ncbi:MAG: PilZ domain-containing protein [Kangiellaceae bacterium]|nr:PilZ domain-containing protein [Kangiellaceae bacterium]
MDIVERRIANRYQVNLPAVLSTVTGEALKAQVSNISISGLHIVINNADLPMLLPNNDREFKIETVAVGINMLLPPPFKPVEVNLGIVYLKRVSMHQTGVGCRFESFVGQSSRTLFEYILHLENNSASNYAEQPSLNITDTGE